MNSNILSLYVENDVFTRNLNFRVRVVENVNHKMTGRHHLLRRNICTDKKYEAKIKVVWISKRKFILIIMRISGQSN